jgi:signal-transduction protein with cAMP-binding, CBS, and nucleotidyltransferase domain
MEQIQEAIRQMITISDDEIDNFLKFCTLKTFKRRELLSKPEAMINELYFINKGIARVTILDQTGTEHTTHFALENHFIADYASFILKEPSIYSLEALEETEVVIMPRTAIEWGYKNLKQGDILGRKVAEFYFIYNDMRIKNLYIKTPKERYDSITDIFPNIHNRVPQHMIASYLGITPIHLSRLKKADYEKV